MSASPLLSQHLHALREAAQLGPILDLACGGGRNGLYLQRQGLPVVFADIREAALREISLQLERSAEGGAELWQVDLERPGDNPLAGKAFAAIVVFHYLHRPLLPAIREAVAPGGLVIYETFTVEQAHYGRPKNPDFLLQPGELQACFAGWEILQGFEGVIEGDGRARAIANIVARRLARARGG